MTIRDQIIIINLLKITTNLIPELVMLSCSKDTADGAQIIAEMNDLILTVIN